LCYGTPKISARPPDLLFLITLFVIGYFSLIFLIYYSSFTISDLKDRLIDFSISVSGNIDKLPPDKFVNHLLSQLVRSSISLALNYGEAQGAECLSAERNRNNKE